MGTVGRRERSLSFNSVAKLEQARCVTVTHATGLIVYTAAGAVPTGVTIGPSEFIRDNTPSTDNYSTEVIMIASVSGSEFITPASAISRGDELEVIGTDGKVQTQSGGTAIGLRAQGAGALDELVAAYLA